ncbi:hypothetical protein [Novosphingobium humi]|uniref:Uncharacterized protein n=1 Tax=Novosphingobium humi TaxID=2282397 RepID=A0ABY7U0P7_9SPHN|nr:hypothetical protein [Novosphingobium humi]WCT78861.1 hypothetical protein PQ457_07865 [Novosphingobium humi]
MIIYHVVRRQWYRPGIVVDTNNVNWGNSLGLNSNNTMAAMEIVRLYKKGKTSLESIVELAIDAFNSKLNGLECYKKHKSSYDTALNLYDVERFVKTCARYNQKFRNSNDGLRVREVLFEDIRKNFAPQAHSRLKSAFGFDNIDDANLYLQECKINGDSDRKNSIICTLEIGTDASTSIHCGSFIDDVENHSTYFESEALLRAYWAGDASQTGPKEILISGTFEYGDQLG